MIAHGLSQYLIVLDEQNAQAAGPLSVSFVRILISLLNRAVKRPPPRRRRLPAPYLLRLGCVKLHHRHRDALSMAVPRSTGRKKIIPANPRPYFLCHTSSRPITDTPVCVAGEVGPVPGWFGETRAKSPGLRERRFSSGS
jgi:hypothetical protein